MVRRSGIVEDLHNDNWRLKNELISYRIHELYDRNRRVRTGYCYTGHTLDHGQGDLVDLVASRMPSSLSSKVGPTFVAWRSVARCLSWGWKARCVPQSVPSNWTARHKQKALHTQLSLLWLLNVGWVLCGNINFGKLQKFFTGSIRSPLTVIKLKTEDPELHQPDSTLTRYTVHRGHLYRETEAVYVSLDCWIWLRHSMSQILKSLVRHMISNQSKLISTTKCSHTLYVPYGFGHTVHGFGTKLACFSVFSFRFEDFIADPTSPNHLHHETCSVACRSLFCSTTLSNSNVFLQSLFCFQCSSKQH